MFYLAFKTCTKQYPEKTAVIVKDLEISYQELDNAIYDLANQLHKKGLRPGQAVLILLPNGIEFVISIFSVMALGAIAVPVNNKFPQDELRYYINSSDAKFILYDGASDLTGLHGGRCIDIPVLFAHLTENQSADRSAGIYPHVNDSDAAIYMYSSGSTGKPKRVTRTHTQLIAEVKAMATTIKLSANDNILCTVPMYHAHGFGNCLMAALLNGGTLVIIQGEFNARDTMRSLEKYWITIYPSVPFMLKMLSEAFFKSKPNLANLRLLFSAGAALSPDIADNFWNKFNRRIKQLYGSTETGAVAINYNCPDGSDASVGSPLHNMEIDILSEEGVLVEAGVIGEVAIKAASMTIQYDGLPEITAESFINGYFLPGDLGCFDDNGCLHIKGRKKLLINVAGYKVDPLDVEAVIGRHPKVADVVVLGQSDPNYGEMVKAVVVARTECTEDEIIAHCAQHLIQYKVPKIVVFRSEIPRSPLGKILRKYLQN